MSTTKPAKFKTPTCALCRQRKLRCDGGDPCGPCSRTRTPVTCKYVPKTVGQLRSELPKGGACIACRQRKRRCDGNFPCRTCKDAGRADECQYRDKSDHGSGTGARRNSSPDTASTSSSAASSLPRLFTPENSVAIPSISSYDLFFPWSDSCPFDSGLNSLDYATLLRPDSADLELSTPRHAFLKRRWQNGLSLTPAKQEALSAGDLSGRVVDPTLVYVCDLLGRSVQVPDWGRYTGLGLGGAFDSALGLTDADLRLFMRDKLEGPVSCLLDPLVRLQTYTLLAMHAAQKEDAGLFQDVMRKASDLVVLCSPALGLEDAPALEWCPLFDESYLSPRGRAEEVRAAFAFLVCLDVTAGLNMWAPETVDRGLVEVFRRLANTHRSDTEINFLRAKSVLFLRDSQELAAEWRRRWPQDTLSGWSKRYDFLIDSIHAHVNFITTSLMEVSCIPSLSDAQPTLKACIVLCLAAAAELHGLFAGEQTEARRRWSEAVGEIRKTERGFSERDWRYLDSTLTTCWSVASRRLQENAVVY